MYENGFSMHEWRQEAVRQYRSYLEQLPHDTEEYREIKRGIETLESVQL
ncbi:MAG TPA: hypothetical protein VF857_08670 [Spirochaetota bacterium]